MIETFYGTGTLDSPQAFLLALIIGLFFGFSLERAGFGSSRRLAGIFYFKDMAVLKVMFSAVLTAMIGLSYLLAWGFIAPDHIYFMPSVYGAYAVGGILLGIGFAMAGWCPGTAAVGLASGKLDALFFLIGTIGGSILFNEVFPLLKPLYSWGDSGVRFIYDSIGMSRSSFTLIFTLVAVACFWGSELIERLRTGGGALFKSPFLKAFSVALVILAGGLFILPAPAPGDLDPAGLVASSTHVSSQQSIAASEAELLLAIEHGEDHIAPTELADRLMSGQQGLTLIDIRTPEEFAAFHIRGAVNVPVSQLEEFLQTQKNRGLVVLYSNGMTHPAQARDSLYRRGFTNVYILTDGLRGFMETCLKPVSLRSEPLPPEFAKRVNSWRQFFTGTVEGPSSVVQAAHGPSSQGPSKLVEPQWLASNLSRTGIKVIDVRTQPEYNTSHIPGSLFISVESFRGMVGGVPSLLLPPEMLAAHFSLMGLEPSDFVVIVPGDRPLDATLVAMAFDRLGHQRFGVLDGGFGKWVAEKHPVGNDLPTVSQSQYPVRPGTDGFTVGYQDVLEHMQRKGTVILDVRPHDFYIGKKTDEARAGHIPGAINRPFSDDTTKTDELVRFKPIEELAAAYKAIIPSKDTPVVVHCRTGHQASQTFFVLKHLLGYTDVSWYDAGWTEWAARRELPVETGPKS